jgi:hypothetical protein
MGNFFDCFKETNNEGQKKDFYNPNPKNEKNHLITSTIVLSNNNNNNNNETNSNLISSEKPKYNE